MEGVVYAPIIKEKDGDYVFFPDSLGMKKVHYATLDNDMVIPYVTFDNYVLKRVVAPAYQSARVEAQAQVHTSELAEAQATEAGAGQPETLPEPQAESSHPIVTKMRSNTMPSSGTAYIAPSSEYERFVAKSGLTGAANDVKAISRLAAIENNVDALKNVLDCNFSLTQDKDHMRYLRFVCAAAGSLEALRHLFGRLHYSHRYMQDEGSSLMAVSTSLGCANVLTWLIRRKKACFLKDGRFVPRTEEFGSLVWDILVEFSPHGIKFGKDRGASLLAMAILSENVAVAQLLDEERYHYRQSEKQKLQGAAAASKDSTMMRLAGCPIDWKAIKTGVGAKKAALEAQQRVAAPQTDAIA